MDISRRDMFAGAGAVAATSALGTRAFGGWEPSERYPDPAIKSLDPSFNNIAFSMPATSGSRPACAGAKGRSGSEMRAA